MAQETNAPMGPAAPPQYYRLNVAKVTWPELRRASANPFVFIMSAPILAFCKLFRLSLFSAEYFPHDITYLPADVNTLGARAERVDHILRSVVGLGFEHFSTFRVPELPYDNVIFALMNREEQAYADIYHVITPMKNIVYTEFVTCLADGGGLTTVNNREAVATESPPLARRQALHGASPEALWQAHRAKLAELAPAAGGVSGPVSVEHYAERFRQAWRRFADFQVQRGAWVPAEQAGKQGQ